MDLAGVQRLTCSLPAVSRLDSLTHKSTPNHAAIIFSSEGLVRLGPAADTGFLTQAVLAPALITSPERAEDTRPSQLCGRPAVSAPGAAPKADAPYALSGYGSARSDNVPTLEPCGQGLSPRNDPFTPAAILAPAE